MEKRELYLVRDAGYEVSWRICRINGIEQDKGQSYPDLEAFWQEETQTQIQEGWKGAAVDQGENDMLVTFWREIDGTKKSQEEKKERI